MVAKTGLSPEAHTVTLMFKAKLQVRCPAPAKTSRAPLCSSMEVSAETKTALQNW